MSRSVEARQSVDPLASQPRPTVYTPGKVYTLHSPQELDQMVADRQNQLLVLMCKASHCKPCKRFGPTYSRMAELLPDSVLLEITGDETPETKKWMVGMGIKVTPTFRVYRGGEMVGTTTGAKLPKILPLILEQLKDGERGKFLTEEEIEGVSDSDDE